MAVAAASAWASRPAGRWGASAASASAREGSSVMAVAAASAWASRLGGQVGRQRGQRLGAGVVVGDGGGGGQRLGQDRGFFLRVHMVADREQGVSSCAGIGEAACVVESSLG